jgi:L-lysine exporter family protein LysE/ArgO
MIDLPNIMPLIQGVVLGAGICVSLGPQTVLVLRQGMRGDAAYAVAAICTTADFLLIAVAAVGAHSVVRLIPDAAGAAAWGAALCCGAYGCFALHSARRQRGGEAGVRPASVVRAQAILAAFALSLLNPQTYLEMVLLVGSVALVFPPGERALFALGVALVSPVWFFGLAVGGRRFAGLFSRPRAARILDVATGVVMLAMAAALINNQLLL